MADEKTLKDCPKFWWSDDEEIIRSEAFETREQAYSDAYCYRARCFDEPSETEGFYLHIGEMVANPDFDAEEYKRNGFDEDNFQQLFKGKTERIDGLTVTDMFHDQWVKLSRPVSTPAIPAELGEAVDAGELYIKTDGCNYPHISKTHVRTLITAATSSQSLRDENTALREALAYYAEAKNWLLNGHLDPNSSRFSGAYVAEKALSTYRGKEASDAT